MDRFSPHVGTSDRRSLSVFWLLDSSSACLNALASLSSCSSSIDVGIVLATAVGMCVAKFDSLVGRFCAVGFLLASMIVVRLDSLLQTAKGTALKSVLMLMSSEVWFKMHLELWVSVI